MKRRIAILGAATILLVAALIYGSVLFTVGGEQTAKPETWKTCWKWWPWSGRASTGRLRWRIFSTPMPAPGVFKVCWRKLEDPYTRLMDQHAYESLMSDTSEVFSGIGIVIGIRDSELTIISPIKGTPGEQPDCGK